MRGRLAIPACAGQPQPPPWCALTLRAYPRVCGATGQDFAGPVYANGLSPRVRGNRFWVGLPFIAEGPIPACAGQPQVRTQRGQRNRAYPRVCGATVNEGFRLLGLLGLSPRVRGNPRNLQYLSRQTGPIPACAGQPRQWQDQLRCARAYPRVCGATVAVRDGAGAGKGLSPRVRGNPGHHRGVARVLGPIPACAGQPSRCPGGADANEAYPRVCGATATSVILHASSSGLSPRVRGNPREDLRPNPSIGPIPACAGQPAGTQGREGNTGAYPRVCGATSPMARSAALCTGLSPRVRGNRRSA